MTELEELRLAYAECSRQKNELLTRNKVNAAELRRLAAEVERLTALVKEASEWVTYQSEYSEFGYRHCCNSPDYKPHSEGCRFAAAVKGGA
jgi:hypothetical protein